MAAFVFDASVIAALYVREDDSDASEAAFARLTPVDQVHVPDFLLLEIANVFWKRVRRRVLPGDGALRAVNDIAASPIHFHPTGLLAPQALTLAIAHGFTAYDAAYVALATRVGGILVTNDRKLHRLGLETGIPVVSPRELVHG